MNVIIICTGLVNNLYSPYLSLLSYIILYLVTLSYILDAFKVIYLIVLYNCDQHI